MADGVSVGSLFATLKLDESPFRRSVGSVGGLFGGLVGFATKGAAIVTGALVGTGIAASRNADEQERAWARVSAIYGAQAKGLDDYSEKMARAWGVEDDAIEINLAKYGAWGKNVGLTTKQSADGAKALAERAAQISLATGKSFQDVFDALFKGQQGMTRGLKEYGVVIGKTDLVEEARRLHLIKGNQQLTERQAAIARANIILRQTASYTKVAADQEGGLVIQQRRLGEVVDEVMDTIGIAFEKVALAVLPSLVDAGRNFADWVGANMPAIQRVIEGIVRGIGAAFGFLTNQVFPRVAAVIGWLATNVLPGLERAFDVITNEVLPALFASSDATASAIGPLFGDAFAFIANTVIPAVADAFAIIATQVLPALRAAFASFVENALPVLQAAFQAIVTDVLPALANGFDLLTTEVIPAISAAISWIATNILPPLSEAFTAIAENVIPILAAAFNTVVDVIRDNWPTISSIAESVGGAVKTAVDVISAVIKAAAPVIRWLAETIFPVLGAAAGVLLHVIDGAFKAIGVVWNAAWDIAKGVAKGIGDAFSALTGVFNTVGSAISGVFRGSMNFLIGIVNGIIRAVDSIQVHIGRIGLDTPAGFIGVGPFDWNGLQIPQLRYLAQGGVVTAPTLAMIGEGNRREAVIPLDDPRFRGLFQGGAGGQVIRNYNLTVQGDLRAPDEASVLTTLQRLAEVGA
ncbi:MAG TPA: hypothetical protein VFI34_07670 [Candidatus Limnocylindrales bacterium]|nr:hypothetical protein [Candidatus Limnocylindrales bacterium]